MKYNAHVKAFLLGMGLFIVACFPPGSVAEDKVASVKMQSVECHPMEGMTFICGLKNPEDLVRLGKTRWVVVSSFQLQNERGKVPGPLFCVDIYSHEISPLFPADTASVDWNQALYPGCSEPPDMFSSHGLDVREMSETVFRLYAVNHGNRESVEIIDLETGGKVPVATWRGCLLSPESIVPNGVVGLPNGGVAVSGGGVAVWRPGKGWHEYENVLARTNGISVSADGKYLYVNSAEAGTVNRFPIDGEMSNYEVLFDGDFHADNLRWGDDGFLYNAGPSEKEQTIGEAITTSVWNLGWGVSRIDPVTGESEILLERKAVPGVFGGATTALAIGDYLWLGTFHGDRIAIIPKP